MTINKLEEKEFIFGEMQYIYWPVMANDKRYIITAFNNTSLNIHIGDNNNDIDAVLFPKVTHLSKPTLSYLLNIIIELLSKSAETYQGSETTFTAYFLLQSDAESRESSIIEKNRKGIHITYMGLTKTAGISFNKYAIAIIKDDL